MNEHQQNVAKVQKALNQSIASIPLDPFLTQRVLHAARNENAGKRKVSAALVLGIVFALMATIAAAATLLNRHIEKAMDITKEKGVFSEWTLDDKLALISVMDAEGISLPQDLRNAVNSSVSDQDKEQAANRLLTSIYGSAENFGPHTMASHDWGDPFLWTLEQKEWFWETLRAKGLYTGQIQYLLPEKNDLSPEQAARLAKQAIQKAYGLPEETLQAYAADVTFFTIFGIDTAPRWRVYLGHAEAEAADYAVLLTREGQITEDASLYIFLPGTSALPSSHESTAVETPVQKRKNAAHVLYCSSSDSFYHFLPDCPAAPNESLMSEMNIQDVLESFAPCPYCALHTALWSVEDKILYGVMAGELPDDSVLSAAQAQQFAKEYLLAQDATEVDAMVPYLRYLCVDGRRYYQVFFAQLANGQIEPLYCVIVDAETGEVSRFRVLESGGKG